MHLVICTSRNTAREPEAQKGGGWGWGWKGEGGGGGYRQEISSVDSCILRLLLKLRHCALENFTVASLFLLPDMLRKGQHVWHHSLALRPVRAEGWWRRILYRHVYILFSYIISLKLFCHQKHMCTGEFLEEQGSKWPAAWRHRERSESRALTVSHRKFVLYGHVSVVCHNSHGASQNISSIFDKSLTPSSYTLATGKWEDRWMFRRLNSLQN